MRFSFAVAAVLLLAVAGARESRRPMPPDKPCAVLVWKVIVPAEKSGKVRTCPVCGGAIGGAELAPHADLIMRCRLKENLNSLKGYEFIFQGGENASGAKVEENIAKMLDQARKKNADTLLVPVLLRYRELVGKGYAAKSPASVAFHLHLIRARDSREIWRFTYNETQRPLSENVLELKKFWKRRFKWVKAERLLIEGMRKAIRTFPKCEATSP